MTKKTSIVLIRKNRVDWNFYYDGHVRAFIHKTNFGNLYKINFVNQQVEKLTKDGWVSDNDTVRPEKLILDQEFHTVKV